MHDQEDLMVENSNASIVILVHKASQISSLEAKGYTQNTATVFCLLKADSECTSPMPPYSRNTPQNSMRMLKHYILQSNWD